MSTSRTDEPVLDLALSPEQQQLRDVVAGFLARECPPGRVRDAEPLGHDADLWKHVIDLGLPGLAVPSDLGGGGGGLLDASVVAEELGARLAPVPVVESVVAARLLVALGRLDEASTVVAGTIATVALRPDEPAQLVPAGAVAEIGLARRGGRLLLGRTDPPLAAPANTGCAPLAPLNLRAADVVAEGEDAVSAHARAVDEWRVLLAAQLVGVARQSLLLARDYVTTRRQFGVPIGAFQAVAHPLADDATAVDGAQLLVHEAAWAADEGRSEAPALASMALTFAIRTARAATANALHFHGGYGFMVEYDVQLYYRRAKAWPLVLGDPRRELQHLADVLWGAPT